MARLQVRGGTISDLPGFAFGFRRRRCGYGGQDAVALFRAMREKAGEGNRTLVSSLGSSRTAIVLLPRQTFLQIPSRSDARNGFVDADYGTRFRTHSARFMIFEMSLS